MAKANSTTKHDRAAIAGNVQGESSTSLATASATSHSKAFQPSSLQREPTAPDATYRSGPTINRRSLMNMMVSTAIVGATVPFPHPSMARAIMPGDAALMDLAGQYIVAEQRYCDLNHQVDVMSDERGPPPEELRILPSDTDFGITPWKETDEFWGRPCDIQKWQKLDKWVSLKNVSTDDRMELVMVRQPPSPELRARAEQIVAAYDQWKAAGERPAGYDDAVRKMEEAEELYRDLEATIAETRAATVEGLFAKVRCAQAYMKTEGVIDGIEQGGAAETMALSIFEDIQVLIAHGAKLNT